MCEDGVSGLRHDKEILDPHATDPYTIEPRFHGHHLTNLQMVLDARTQPRRLMNQQSDPMASRVCDKIGDSAPRKLVPAPRIDVTAANSWANHLHGVLLNLAYRLVHLVKLIRTSTDEKRACHVGVIALNECPDVDDDGVPLADNPRTGR